jgi:hypothetical protein
MLTDDDLISRTEDGLRTGACVPRQTNKTVNRLAGSACNGPPDHRADNRNSELASAGGLPRIENALRTKNVSLKMSPLLKPSQKM